MSRALKKFISVIEKQPLKLKKCKFVGGTPPETKKATKAKKAKKAKKANEAMKRVTLEHPGHKSCKWCGVCRKSPPGA